MSQRHGSADPDLHQNVMDLEHWSRVETHLMSHQTINSIIYQKPAVCMDTCEADTAGDPRGCLQSVRLVLVVIL
jgi:hypothetical protein